MDHSFWLSAAVSASLRSQCNDRDACILVSGGFPERFLIGVSGISERSCVVYGCRGSYEQGRIKGGCIYSRLAIEHAVVKAARSDCCSFRACSVYCVKAPDERGIRMLRDLGCECVYHQGGMLVI